MKQIRTIEPISIIPLSYSKDREEVRLISMLYNGYYSLNKEGVTYE